MLAPEEREALEQLVRTHSTPQQLALRVRIIVQPPSAGGTGPSEPEKFCKIHIVFLVDAPRPRREKVQDYKGWRGWGATCQQVSCLVAIWASAFPSP